MHPFPVPYQTPEPLLREVIKGEDKKADYKALNSAVHALGVNIPPHQRLYGLSP